MYYLNIRFISAGIGTSNDVPRRAVHSPRATFVAGCSSKGGTVGGGCSGWG